MGSLFVVLAGLAGFAGVAAGASARHFAGGDALAHEWLDIASRYLLLHAVALLALSSRLDAAGRGAGFARKAAILAGFFFILGMVLFGGGLIFHAATGSVRFGWVVPVGGTSFLIGWLAVFLSGASALLRGRR
jgi:uncharacterized membrane protein YgdD (TMEM256/DUF423 family)